MVIGKKTATISAAKQAVTSPLTAGCHRCVRHIKKRPYGKQTTRKKTVFHVARFRRRGALCIAGFLDSPEFDKFLENIVSHWRQAVKGIPAEFKELYYGDNN